MSDPNFDAKVQMVVTTYHEVFGLCSVDVVLQALSISIARILFACFSQPHQRRMIMERLDKQVEVNLTRYEKGSS